jgi:phosphoglycolate phosphatase
VKTALVLFDLDGTLVDSAPDIATAANAALAAVGMPPRGEAEIRDFIGSGAERLLHRCLTGARDGLADQAWHADAYAAFQASYLQCLTARTRPYEGVVATLDALRARGIALGCVTNKPLRFALPLLANLALAPYFAVTYGGDSFAVKKPDPLPLQAAARACGARVEETVMVGDSSADLYAARAAGMRIFCVGYGYAGDVDLADLAPDALVATMPGILALL